MYIDPYYKVIQLKSFIGERKLKQVGLLHCQGCPPLSMVKNAPSITLSVVDAIDPEMLSLSDYTSEELTEQVLAKYSPTTSLYRPSTQNYGLLDSFPTQNSVALQELEDDFLCPECGKAYHPLPSQGYEALPIYLSDVEADALKGIFVDLYL